MAVNKLDSFTLEELDTVFRGNKDTYLFVVLPVDAKLRYAEMMVNTVEAHHKLLVAKTKKLVKEVFNALTRRNK